MSAACGRHSHRHEEQNNVMCRAQGSVGSCPPPDATGTPCRQTDTGMPCEDASQPCAMRFPDTVIRPNEGRHPLGLRCCWWHAPSDRQLRHGGGMHFQIDSSALLGGTDLRIDSSRSASACDERETFMANFSSSTCRAMVSFSAASAALRHPHSRPLAAALARHCCSCSCAQRRRSRSESCLSAWRDTHSASASEAPALGLGMRYKGYGKGFGLPRHADEQGSLLKRVGSD
jgi:hypothetical protein